MKVKVCHCCGHPVPPEGVKAILAPRQLRMFEIVERAGQAGISGSDIMSMLYADDPEGGPASVNIVAVTATHIRKKLAPFGLTLRGRKGRGKGTHYKILPLEK